MNLDYHDYHKTKKINICQCDPMSRKDLNKFKSVNEKTI